MTVSDVKSQPKIRHKTFAYSTDLRWTEDRSGVLSSEDRPELGVASPPEFKGPPGVWTPEHLFVAAVDICTMTTFVAFARHKKIPIVSYQSHAEGTLEFVDGGYQFTRITLRPRVVVGDATLLEQASAVLKDAHASCLVSNSIKSEVLLEPTVEGSGQA